MQTEANFFTSGLAQAMGLTTPTICYLNVQVKPLQETKHGILDMFAAIWKLSGRPCSDEQ